MRLAELGLVLVVSAWPAGAQGFCFRSVREAVRQAGVADVGGYRVEGMAWDAFHGSGWARVRSCGHPEWPARVVSVAEGRPPVDARPGFVKVGQTGLRGVDEVVVRAGALVRVTSAGEMVRMEVAGTAVEGGAVGQRVRVRVPSEGEERFVVGVVKSADVLEMAR